MKILVVDDEPAVAISTALVFERQGHVAKTASSSEEALRMISEFQPDLLLADVILAGMNGIELSIKMCAEMPQCRVLLFSGQADTADLLQEARQRGFHFDIVAKPISPVDLLARVNAMVGHAA